MSAKTAVVRQLIEYTHVHNRACGDLRRGITGRRAPPRSLGVSHILSDTHICALPRRPLLCWGGDTQDGIFLHGVRTI